MSSIFEVLTSIDIFNIVTVNTHYLALAAFGMAACGGKGGGGCSCGHDHGDGAEDDEEDSVYAEMESEIEALKEKVEGGDKSARRNLADAYLALAVQLQQDDYLEESISMFDDSLELFDALAKELPSDDSIARLIGAANLSRAIALNDSDEKEEVIEGYNRAEKAVSALAASGDGEAKYDLAGIKLNRGTVYCELGEFDKAQKELDESFDEFRALEKISELDTRYFMAKVSVALGNLYREQDAPVNKIVDVYNRAMRLFVELIDAGDMKYELDLANVLVDKCMARYEAGEGEAVLVDMQRGIDIIEKCAKESNEIASLDLFSAMSAYGIMLLDLEKFNDALSVFDETIEKFKLFEHLDNPILLNDYASLYDNRGMCLINLKRNDEAIESLGKAIEMRESFWTEEWDLDDDQLAQFAPHLVSAYCNRAYVYDSTGKRDLAVDDCKKAMNALEPYADDLGKEYDELCKQIKEIQNG